MSLNTITQFRLPDGSVVGLVDWVDKPLYSCVDLLTGWTDNEIDLFTYTVGQPVPMTGNATVARTSTERDTNVQTPGGNASSEELMVHAIRPMYYAFRLTAQGPTDMTTFQEALPGYPGMPKSMMNQMHAYLTLRLMVTQKCFFEAGLGYYNSGCGALGQAYSRLDSTDGTPSYSTATAGTPSADAVRSFAVPIHIGGQEKWYVSLNNPTGTTMTYIQDDPAEATNVTRTVIHFFVYIDGLRKRGVA